jgi:hypothetical protein
MNADKSLVQLANRKNLEKINTLKKRELSSSPMKNSLDQIKSIYETNILKDPIFNGKQRSQLRNWKEHTTRLSISPMRVHEQALNSINGKTIQEGEEEANIRDKANKTLVVIES